MTEPELAIILPVYNEQASVRKVVLEWFQEIENWTEIEWGQHVDDNFFNQKRPTEWTRPYR